jgi:hypothetical protein
VVLSRIITGLLCHVLGLVGAGLGLALHFLVHSFALHPGIAGDVSCSLLPSSEQLVEKAHLASCL